MSTSDGSDVARPSVKVELQDHKLLRRELEAETLQAVQDYGLVPSYVEDNIQLFMSTLMCATVICCDFLVVCGAAAHLLPGKFVEHQAELKSCVIAYYVLVAITFIFSWFTTKDNFLVLCASEEHKMPRVGISLKLPRFGTHFKLVFSSKDSSYTSPSMSVEHFFHEDGYVARTPYHVWVHKQLKAFPSASLASSKKTK